MKGENTQTWIWTIGGRFPRFHTIVEMTHRPKGPSTRGEVSVSISKKLLLLFSFSYLITTTDALALAFPLHPFKNALVQSASGTPLSLICLPCFWCWYKTCDIFQSKYANYSLIVGKRWSKIYNITLGVFWPWITTTQIWTWRTRHRIVRSPIETTQVLTSNRTKSLVYATHFGKRAISINLAGFCGRFHRTIYSMAMKVFWKLAQSSRFTKEITASSTLSWKATRTKLRRTHFCRTFGIWRIIAKLQNFVVVHWAPLINTGFAESTRYQEQFGTATKRSTVSKRNPETRCDGLTRAIVIHLHKRRENLRKRLDSV